MTREELIAVQAPIKQMYKDHPEKAIAELTAELTIGKDLSCLTKAGNTALQIGLHPSVGGSQRYICPAELLLDSVGSCVGITLSAVATNMGITIKKGTIRARGTVDLRGTLGVSSEAQVGLNRIEVSVDLDTDAAEAEVDELLQMTEKYAVVYQTLQKKPELVITSAKR
jgi:uncharacterized OsmC-like protein